MSVDFRFTILTYGMHLQCIYSVVGELHVQLLVMLMITFYLCLSNVHSIVTSL